MSYIAEMRNVTKEFPGIIANDNVTLQVKQGEIHALLGENGAGKSTLMSMLFGLYQPTKGEIYVRGEKVEITDPNVATKLKIGMVHQHFKLVDNYTITENIMLGVETETAYNGKNEKVRKVLNGIAKVIPFKWLDRKKVSSRIKELSSLYGLEVDPNAKIEDITVSMQQRVEILKMLYRDAEILIFDEPTAVLTPQEIESLIKIMKNLVQNGKTIILITHKLNEIKLVADRCTILRRGRFIDTVNVKDVSVSKLAELMVGREVSFNVEKDDPKFGKVVFEVKDLCVKDSRNLEVVKNVSFSIREGEVFGIAGVSGNGQIELTDAIVGLRKQTSGTVILRGEEVSKLSIRQKAEKGISYIPEDRQKYGLVLEYNLSENIALKNYYKKPYSNYGILNFEQINKNSDELISKYDVRSSLGGNSTTRDMSGGNQQKAIIAREIEQQPNDLLIVVQPTRGLDVGAIEFIHKQIIKARDAKKAILLISLELDEVMDLSDTIAVMYSGKILKTIDAKLATEKDLGKLMMGITDEGGKQ